MGIQVLFLLSEILVLLIWLHCPFWDLPSNFQYGCSRPPWPRKWIFLQLDKINLQLILKLKLYLLRRLFLPPFFPLHLVKVLTLLDRWIRKIRKSRRRRRIKFNKGATRQPFLRMQILLRNHPISLTNFYTLANFVQDTIFFEIVMVFLKSYKNGLLIHIIMCYRLLEIMLVTHHQLVVVKFMERRVKLSFLIGYAKGITPFTFVPI